MARKRSAVTQDPESVAPPAEPKQADWSESMTRALITVLQDEVRQGKRAENGFKQASFERAMNQVNRFLDGRGNLPNLSVSQVRTKYNAVSPNLGIVQSGAN
jgi:hypothetical protein